MGFVPARKQIAERGGGAVDAHFVVHIHSECWKNIWQPKRWRHIIALNCDHESGLDCCSHWTVNN
jgi:hypothetical protein